MGFLDCWNGWVILWVTICSVFAIMLVLLYKKAKKQRKTDTAYGRAYRREHPISEIRIYRLKYGTPWKPKRYLLRVGFIRKKPRFRDGESGFVSAYREADKEQLLLEVASEITEYTGVESFSASSDGETTVDIFDADNDNLCGEWTGISDIDAIDAIERVASRWKLSFSVQNKSENFAFRKLLVRLVSIPVAIYCYVGWFELDIVINTKVLNMLAAATVVTSVIFVLIYIAAWKKIHNRVNDDMYGFDVQ